MDMNPPIFFFLGFKHKVIFEYISTIYHTLYRMDNKVLRGVFSTEVIATPSSSFRTYKIEIVFSQLEVFIQSIYFYIHPSISPIFIYLYPY